MILCRKMRQPCSGRLDVLGLFLVHSLLFLQVPRKALAKCPNWCSQKGICTGPGDDAFCICEMGHQGDDCGTRESLVQCTCTLLYSRTYGKKAASLQDPQTSVLDLFYTFWISYIFADNIDHLQLSCTG